MATKIRKSTSSKKTARFKRKKRIRAQIQGTAERPRMAVFRSNKHMYVQVIDDLTGKTLVAAGTIEGDLREKFSASIEGAKAVGALIAKRAISKNISKVVFDRAGYLYHGRIRALADAAREAGLQF